jgi:hypothetical protein
MLCVVVEAAGTNARWLPKSLSSQISGYDGSQMAKLQSKVVLTLARGLDYSVAIGY